MKRAFNAIADDSSAHAQMSAQMRAVSVQNAGFALFGSEDDQVLAYIDVTF